MWVRLKSLIKGYGLSAIVAIVCGLCSAGVVVVSNSAPDAYEPVVMRPVNFITAQPYHVGQEVTILNGLCNTTKETLQSSTIIGFKEVGKDTLVARNIVIRPTIDPAGKLGVTPLAEPLYPGCVGIKNGVSEPITGPLPESLPPGHWSLYILMTIDGAGGKRQKITTISPTITVIP